MSLFAAPVDEGDWSSAGVIDWLYAEGRFIDDRNELTRELGERLVASGAPIVRLRIAMRILHPLRSGWSAIWEASGRLVRDQHAAPQLEGHVSYVGSPLEHLARTGRPFRRRLGDGLTADDHQLLHDLKAEGATDYFGAPLTFTTGQVGGLIVMTDRAGGFTDADIARFEALATIVCPIMEAKSAYEFASTIATTYIGPRSGTRVLDGNITRGDVETLRAAIWFSDLFGWSRLANTMTPQDAVALANDYFEIVDDAVTGAGGEVLKLIGDAALAIFPIDGDAANACASALAAAREARRRADDAGRPVAFGIGLHLGDLAYGNVGSPSRLDFTVMGQAVNLAARIEKLTRSLDQPVILSEAFAMASPGACADLGTHPVAGWDAPVRVYAPPTL